jgi:hypothetical protein
MKIWLLPRGPLGAIPPSHPRVTNLDGSPAQAELHLVPGRGAYGIVKHEAGVLQQIEGLARLPHHPQVEDAVQDAGLHTTDAGGTVLAEGADERDPALLELRPAHRCQFGGSGFELLPDHVCSLLSCLVPNEKGNGNDSASCLFARNASSRGSFPVPGCKCQLTSAFFLSGTALRKSVR